MALVRRTRPAPKPAETTPPPPARKAPVRHRATPRASAPAQSEEPKDEKPKVIPIALHPVSPETIAANQTVERYLAKVKNPMTAIRARCVQCCCGSFKEVETCRSKTCALHPFRMGVNPFNKKTRERLNRETDNQPGDEDE